jgi:hypothetical protein
MLSCLIGQSVGGAAPRTAESPTVDGVRVIGAFLLSWTGFVVHNFADLPGQTFLSPETLFPTLVFAVLLFLWFTPARRGAAWATLVWAVLHLVGGAVISVLPLPILPFDPDQSVRHYLFHLLYAAPQIPLVLFAWRASRATLRARPTDPPVPRP